MIKRIKRFCSSDVELRTETYWEGGKEKIDGFYFLSKNPSLMPTSIVEQLV